MDSVLIEGRFPGVEGVAQVVGRMDEAVVDPDDGEDVVIRLVQRSDDLLPGDCDRIGARGRAALQRM